MGTAQGGVMPRDKREPIFQKGGRTSFREVVGGTKDEPQSGFLLPGAVIDVDGKRTWLALTGPDEDVIAHAVDRLITADVNRRRLAHAEELVAKLYRALSNASEVVDKGEDEAYAYQGEIAAAREFLETSPQG